MNNVSFVGRLTRDTSCSTTASGGKRLNNCLAIPRPYKTENGDDTDFIPIVAWDKRAELIENYCAKGHRVGLSGRMQSRHYQNKNDERVYVVEMLVDQVEFLESKKEGENQPTDFSTTAQLQPSDM